MKDYLLVNVRTGLIIDVFKMSNKEADHVNKLFINNKKDVRWVDMAANERNIKEAIYGRQE